MSDFITELEEDIREEKLFTLWKKYGNFIIGAALVIILTTAGYTLWSYFKKQGQLKQYASFSHAITLMNTGKNEEALKIFQDLSKHTNGYGKLAQLYEASLTSQPEALYERIAQENLKDPALGNLPKLLIALRSLKSPAALSTLQPLTAPRNAWAPLSFELLALAALETGNPAQAVEYYTKAFKESFLTFPEEQRIRLMLAQIELSPAPLSEPKK